MISAARWAAYNKACANVTDKAKAETVARLLAWMASNDYDVSQAREAAKAIADGVLAESARDASALAAEWYDSEAKRAGAKLPHALTVSVGELAAESLDATARYKAAHLLAGDKDAFAQAMGEWVEYQAKKALNDTIMANCRRDAKKGVRYARVTSGINTCAFCLMLASRGAVYHSRKTAGELGKFHSHCSCKIVPSWSNDAHAELVEGHSPKLEAAKWAVVQDVQAAFTGKAREQANAIVQGRWESQGFMDYDEIMASLTAEERQELESLAGTAE